MSFPKYPIYKESGVEWLGDVPEHWDVWKIAHAFTVIGSGTTPKTDNRDYYDDGDIPWVNTGDLNDGELQNCGKRITTLALSDHTSLKLYPTGSLLIAMYGATIGKLAMLGFPATVNQACCVFSGASPIVSKFMFYWFLGLRQQILSLATGGGQPNVSQDILRTLRVGCPERTEQTKIASFLDRETAKIDALVAEQQRLIELLKEKRQAVISHAVTKGLNPDAPMKPSSIEWLGNVPKHWEAGPLKRFWEVVDCKHVTVPFFDEGFPVASVMEVRGFDLDLSQVLRTSEDFFKVLIGGNRQPCRGDVIYCRNTANTGTSAYVWTDEPIAIGQDVVLIKSRRQNGRYLNYILHGTSMAGQLETLMVGSTFKRINVADIRMLTVVCPPKEEQDEIVAFIDSEIPKFDALIDEGQREIDLLQERRTALISAAVTGKIDVRALVSHQGA